MTEKSILEEALLQVNTLEEAVKQNAKGILASTMKQELNEMLKESLEQEEDFAENEEEEEEDETSEETSMDEQGASDEEDEDEIPADDADDLSDLDNDETEGDSEGMDSEMGDEMGDEMDSEMGDEMGDEMDSEMDDEMNSEMDDDALDLTGASDEEVMKVFKAMKPEDGIIVKKNENSLEFSDGENEYLIKLDQEEDEMEEEGEMSNDEEPIYEIELDEEEEEEEEETHEEEMEEAARTKSNPHGNKGGADRAGIDSKKKYKAGSGQLSENYKKLVSEVEKLKKQNSLYKDAVLLFKEKLNEIAIFNASLAYSNRLFTEHSTTKQEKMNILKRFDSINTIEESKTLFKTIKNELDNKKPVTESVVSKITSTPSTSSSQEMLSESKAYENPQFKRMKDLMSKIK